MGSHFTKKEVSLLMIHLECIEAGLGNMEKSGTGIYYATKTVWNNVNSNWKGKSLLPLAFGPSSTAS